MNQYLKLGIRCEAFNYLGNFKLLTIIHVETFHFIRSSAAEQPALLFHFLFISTNEALPSEDPCSTVLMLLLTAFLHCNSMESDLRLRTVWQELCISFRCCVVGLCCLQSYLPRFGSLMDTLQCIANKFCSSVNLHASR